MKDRVVVFLMYAALAVAFLGCSHNIKRYLVFTTLIPSIESMKPLDSAQSSRFFGSPPLSTDQKRLLDQLFTSRAAESQGLHKLLISTFEGTIQNARDQALLWGAMFIALAFGAMRVYRSNKALQGDGPGAARPDRA